MERDPISWTVDPDDPRAPPQDVWDRMRPEERQRVLDALPSKLRAIEDPNAGGDDDGWDWFGGLHPLPETSVLLAGLASKVGDLERRVGKAERRAEEAEQRADAAQHAADEAQRRLASALAEIERLRRERG